jgi:hypothetical protein
LSTELREASGNESLAVPDNPLAILQDALARGTDPDKLGKLMDLADRWKAQQAAEAFAVAMNACQDSMPCVVKDRENPATNSRYATLENLMTVIKPVYLRHGFSLSYGTADSPVAGCTRVTCEVSHSGGCSKTFHLDMPGDSTNKAKSNIQAMGSTVSYGRRYLALMIFNVTVANEDLDGNAADCLDTITEEEVLEVEDAILDTGTNKARFMDWGKTAGVFVGEPAIRNISKKRLAQVLDLLERKRKEKAK